MLLYVILKINLYKSRKFIKLVKLNYVCNRRETKYGYGGKKLKIRHKSVAPSKDRFYCWNLRFHRQSRALREGVQRRHDPRKNDLRTSGFAELPPVPAKLVSQPQWRHQAFRHSVSTPRILVSACCFYFLLFIGLTKQISKYISS